MDALIYSMCALTALGCAVMLLRTYSKTSYKLLLWGGVCFVGLTLNNLLLIFDKLVYPYFDLSTARLVLALCALLVFLYGLIWDSE